MYVYLCSHACIHGHMWEGGECIPPLCMSSYPQSFLMSNHHFVSSLLDTDIAPRVTFMRSCSNCYRLLQHLMGCQEFLVHLLPFFRQTVPSSKEPALFALGVACFFPSFSSCPDRSVCWPAVDMLAISVLLGFRERISN